MAVGSLNVNYRTDVNDDRYGVVFDIYALPEDCIANALSLTSPRDACRLSAVASTFRAAAQSDAVWDRFLPHDYKEIISRSIDGPDLLLSFPSKKDLYLHLCDRYIIIDGGTKSFSLERWTGKKCFMLAARDLKIVWADTPRYWRWVPDKRSRFSEVAELIDVCWLEIQGKINTSMLSPGTTYAAYLVFTTRQGETHGFEYEPAQCSVGVGEHEIKTRSVFLDEEAATRYRYQIVPRRREFFNHRFASLMRRQNHIPVNENENENENGNGNASAAEYPKKRDDGWNEVMLGEFYLNESQDEEELEMSLMEIKSGAWKSGIVIEGIEIRPKSSSE